MKRASTLSAVIFASVTAAFLTSTSAFAAPPEYTQMRDSVNAGLVALHVKTDDLGKLTMVEIDQLTGILDSQESAASKNEQATHLIDASVHPSRVAMNSAEGIAMMTELKADMKRVKLTYAGLDKLNADQVQHLLDVFHRHKKDNTLEKPKQAAEAIFASFDTPGSVVLTNPGVIQLEKEIDSKLTDLGLTAPALGSLSFDQVGKLTAIFDQGGAVADQKTAAMQVLGSV